MTYKPYIVKVEIYDETMKELRATVDAEDECCASVSMTRFITTAEDWKEFSMVISEAIKMMELESE